MKKIFRKIHLWLSVPFGIFITLICFSGSMLVFEKEITELFRHNLYYVETVGERPMPLDELMEAVAATLPDSVSVTGVTVSPDPERAYQVSLSQPRRTSVYVDQYTGEVKGKGERLPFYDVMFHLHRWMMGSSNGVGKQLVGASTLMLVVILLTGILMWLTNRKKPLAMSLKISVAHGWHRFWHDLHVAGGIYVTVFLLALALTGLTWSFSWYRTGFYQMFGVETAADGGHGHGGSNRGQMAEEKRSGRHGQNAGQDTLVADEGAHAYHAYGDDGESGKGRRRGGRHGHGHGRGGRGGYHHYHSPYARWQDIYEELAEKYPGFRQITISDGSASVVPAGRMSLRSGDRFEFDSRSGEVTGTTLYAEQDKAAKVRSSVYMVHVGSWGGMLTRILTFLAALLGATLPLTGYYLWIRKMMVKGRSRHASEKRK